MIIIIYFIKTEILKRGGGVMIYISNVLNFRLVPELTEISMIFMNI